MGSHISLEKTRRLLTALLVGSLAVACSGPFVLIPGGALEGATAATPADWSFTDEVDTIQLETNPGEPYSVNLWIAAADDHLYVHAGDERATWIDHMDADPRVRLQVEDEIYELAASRVETQEEFDRFADAYEVKYGLRPRNENIAEVYLYRLGAPLAGDALSDSPFYTPVATHNPRRFLLPVANELVVGPAERQFLMGGVGLGSAIHALETATERPLVWATAQYLSFAPPGATVDIDVHVPVTGKTVTQARVVSHVGEREILTVNAALGSRPDQAERQYVPMPEVPPPDACPVYTSPQSTGNDLPSRLERRFVVGSETEHDGHALIWIRTLEDQPITAALLAIFADFLPGSIPVTQGSSSLDNTLRIRRLVPARWCLIDSRVQGLASGFFHGELSLFAEDGTLLATASQSGALPKRP